MESPKSPAPCIDKEVVCRALKEMKDGKKAGVSSIVTAVLKALGDIVKEKVPGNWEMLWSVKSLGA